MPMWCNWQTHYPQQIDQLEVRIFSWALYRDVAQLVAHVIWDHEAAGSRPVIPTVCISAATGRRDRLKPGFLWVRIPSGAFVLQFWFVAQWQSNRLLTGRLWVQVPPFQLWRLWPSWLGSRLWLCGSNSYVGSSPTGLPEIKYAAVAQWQCTCFVIRGLRVRVPSAAYRRLGQR